MLFFRQFRNQRLYHYFMPERHEMFLNIFNYWIVLLNISVCMTNFLLYKFITCSLANAQRKNMNNMDRQMSQGLSVIREMSARIHLPKSIEVSMSI